MKKVNLTLAGLLAVMAGALLATMFYLAYVFPRTIDPHARVLPLAQRLLLNASTFCRSYGWALLPGALLVFIGGVVWFVCAMRMKPGANNGVHGSLANSAP